MKIVTWNIRGCNHPRKIRTLDRKIKQEKPGILFLQETKCSFETMQKIGQKIWKGSKVMALDTDSSKGRMTILWKPREVDLLERRAGHFSLLAEFQILGTEIRGTIVNIYGPSAFPQKQAFVHHLHWLCVMAKEGN